MNEKLDQIVENAQYGNGPCEGCPVQEETQGRNVNPGLLNYDAEVMFLTLDPSHSIDWSCYEDWSEYNSDYAERFASWRGGKKLAEIIEPLGLTLDDVWLGDSIKCPVDNSLRRFEDDTAIEKAFAHCSEYLLREVEAVEPTVIVTLGKETAVRLLGTVFNVSVQNLKPGTQDCGDIYSTDPPVVISPHWSHGWLHRAPTGPRNLDRVQEAVANVYRAE